MTTADHSDQGRTRGHDFGLPPDPVSQTKKVVPDRGKHVSRETGGPVGLTAQDAVADTALGRKLVEENKRRDKLKNVQLDRPESTRYITISNQKGGVGKTSTSVNLAVALAEQGQNVLVVDNDPQGNASTALGIPHGSDADSVYDILIDEVPVADVVKQSPESTSLWVLPATIDLAGAEIELVSVVAREQRLQRALAEYATAREEAGLPRLDYVFIDCPPSLGLLTINAFVAATEVLIPIQCEYYALEGLSQLLNNIKIIQRHLNPGLTVSNILLTMYDGRTNLASQVADEVRQHFRMRSWRQ